MARGQNESNGVGQAGAFCCHGRDGLRQRGTEPVHWTAVACYREGRGKWGQRLPCHRSSLAGGAGLVTGTSMHCPNLFLFAVRG